MAIPQVGTQAKARISGVRYHSLDAVRAFALLLGVLYHAAESFEEGVYTFWAIEDNSTSVALDLFRHASHSFRLELFFLIAGFFAALVLAKRGLWPFIRNRLKRILVPLVVGWAAIYPLLALIWITGAAKAGRLESLGIPEEMLSASPLMLAMGHIITLGFVRDFDLTHLWFLHQLLAIYAVVLIARFAVSKLPRGGEGFLSLLDGTFRRVVSSWWAAPALMAICLPLLYLQGGWSVDTPKESLVPDPVTTALYGFIFAVGWVLYRQQDLLEIIARRWKAHMTLGLLLVVPTATVTWRLYELGLFDEYRTPIRIGHYIAYGLMMWFFVLGFLGLFLTHRKGESRTWRYLADSSYWVYIIHLPVVVSLQVWVAHWPVNWAPKFLLINLISFPILYASYHYLVRSTFIGRQLNGRKYPFVAFPWRRPGS
jgi:peptidoglycan/LPS O-acetylase OafA/YrhL